MYARVPHEWCGFKSISDSKSVKSAVREKAGGKEQPGRDRGAVLQRLNETAAFAWSSGGLAHCSGNERSSQRCDRLLHQHKPAAISADPVLQQSQVFPQYGRRESDCRPRILQQQETLQRSWGQDSTTFYSRYHLHTCGCGCSVAADLLLGCTELLAPWRLGESFVVHAAARHTSD
jgi:hypothetical protein